VRSCFAFVAYLVVGLDVQLDLFAGEGADSGAGGGQLLAMLMWESGEEMYVLDLHFG